MTAKLLALGAAAALLCGTAALAQSASPATTPPAASSAAGPSTSTSFSDAQLKSFATVTLAIQKNPGQDAATTAKMVTDSGLSIAEYNQIAAAMKTDPTVNSKIQSFASASPSTNESATSTPAPAGGPPAKTSAPAAPK